MPPGEHMTAEEFRRWGHEVVDWVAGYLERVDDLPVGAQVEPGEVRAQLPPSPAERGEGFEALLADLDRVVVPGLTHWQSPRFFGYFPGNSSGPSVLGELAAAGLGTQAMLWSTGPAATEVEQLALDWLVELLGLPAAFRSDGAGGGSIQEGASLATLCALLAARERAGGQAEGLVAYTSTQAHSSVEKAVRVAGLGRDALRLVEVDERYAMRPSALEAAVAADVAAGLRPAFVCATVGTTSTLAVDPVAAIADVCERHGLWLHVDAALLGVAALLPERRWLNDGVDRADSWCTDPHKWLLVNVDCDAFYVRDRRWLLSALSVLPEYLRNAASESGAVVDFRDWGIPLGRRFRALKLWWVLRWYGAEGLRALLRSHLALAASLAGWVAADPRFELAAPAEHTLVCLRHVGGDEVTERLHEAVNASGRAFVTHTKLDGRYVIRVAVGQARTEQRHVDDLIALLDALAPPA